MRIPTPWSPLYQMWLLPMNGEAQEVLSWRQGTVKTLRILPAPQPTSPGGSGGGRDGFEHCRPLIALADSTGPGAAFTSASFISLRSGEQVSRDFCFENGPILAEEV